MGPLHRSETEHVANKSSLITGRVVRLPAGYCAQLRRASDGALLLTTPELPDRERATASLQSLRRLCRAGNHFRLDVPRGSGWRIRMISATGEVLALGMPCESMAVAEAVMELLLDHGPSAKFEVPEHA